MFTFITYILLDIRSQSSYFISENLEKIKDITKDNRLKIVSFIDKLLWCDKFILFGQFVMIIRLVLIMLEIR